MTLMRIVSQDRNSMFGRRTVKEFEFNEENELFTEESEHHITLLLMAHHSFSVDFYTPEREALVHLGNAILCDVSGYSALKGIPTPIGEP